LYLDETGYLSKINQNKLDEFNKKIESFVYSVDNSFTGFSMLTVITGKCGTVKTSFLTDLILNTNNNVKTSYRNSLIRINSSIAFGSLSCLSETESLEIREAQEQKLEGLQKNFLISFVNKAEKITYSNVKKRSFYTYSSLFMMLQYILNQCHPHFNETRSDSLEFNRKLNDHLKKYEFPYNIHVVNEVLILDNRINYSLWLQPNELNNREQIKLLVLLWLFDTDDTDNIEMKDTVLLLDEIDTECDASSVWWLITGLKHLISKLKIQIVLTTNNPITISLLQLGCLCIIENHVEDFINYACIKKAKTKSEAIATVTDKILFINEPYLIVFVEGRVGNDLILYTIIYQRLKQSESINTISPIIFYQMGDKMFNQFFLKNKATLTNQEAIDNIFGINDGDNLILEAYEHLECEVLTDKTKEYFDKFTPNIKVLKRYNIENYIYDPICIMIVVINLKREYEATANKDEKYGNQLDELFKMLTKNLDQNQIKQLNDTKIDENFIQSIGPEVFNSILANMPDFMIRKWDEATEKTRKEKEIMIVVKNLKKEYEVTANKNVTYGNKLDEIFQMLTKNLDQNQIKQLNDTKIDENFILSIRRDDIKSILTNVSVFMIGKIDEYAEKIRKENEGAEQTKSEKNTAEIAELEKESEKNELHRNLNSFELNKQFTDKLKKKAAKIKQIRVTKDVYFDYHPILLYHNGKNIQNALKNEYNRLPICQKPAIMLKELDRVINLNIYVFNDLEDIIKSFKI
jgi:hypothetical protein